MKAIATFFLSTLFCLGSLAQMTAIPDMNFEQALINLGHDSGVPDGFIPTANISSLTALLINFENITDLTGIEDFSSLTWINCSNNQLTFIDFSQNTSLSYLECNYNQLDSLNITQNNNLEYISCFVNQLTDLDISLLTNLKELNCAANSLTSLNIWNNVSLLKLTCDTNPINNLDFSQNSDLQYVNCNNNQLTNIDVSQNGNLETLYCNNNKITDLNVTQNAFLTALHCRYNSLLSCLNIKNGWNLNNGIGSPSFDASNNPNLVCIEVDDVPFSQTILTNIDPGVYFSENCNNSCSVLGVNDSKPFPKVSVYPNPTTKHVNINLGDLNSNIKATVTNQVGHVFFTQEYSSTDQFVIDINSASGIYFLKLEANDKQARTLKIILIQ